MGNNKKKTFTPNKMKFALFALIATVGAIQIRSRDFETNPETAAEFKKFAKANPEIAAMTRKELEAEADQVDLQTMPEKQLKGLAKLTKQECGKYPKMCKALKAKFGT